MARATVIKRSAFGFIHWSRRIDWPLLLAAIALIGIGFFAVLSAVNPMGNASRFVIKQLVAIGVGAAGLFVVSSLNYQLFRSYPGVFYILTVIPLVAVLLIGRRISGAKSWIAFGPLSFEPVELARIGFILVLAALLDRSEREISSLKILLAAFALAGVHMVLILLEPYLGGVLVYGPITLGMLYFGGVRSIYLLALIFFLSIAGGIPILSTYFAVQPQLIDTHPLLYFFASSAQGLRQSIEFLSMLFVFIWALWWFFRKLQFRIPALYAFFLCLIVSFGVGSAHLTEHFIKDYQRKRIMVFVSPGFDPFGAGYHIIQSQIAIGSGRFFGKGMFSGTQTQLGFLPEQHTDFIFSVIGEEFGFVWASAVILAFGLLVWRAFVIARETQDRFGALIASGIGCLFAWESVMNIGMVLGILPVTGVALPFVSYGGSHMVSSLLAIGLLQSVNFRRYIYA